MPSTLPAELLLTLVLDALPVRIFWKDRDSRYLGSNQAFAEDAGAPAPAALVGRNDFDFFPDEQARAFRADDAAVMKSGVPKLAIEEPLTVAGGDTIWLETNKLPLRSETGEVLGVIGTYRDVTDRHRALEERTRLIEELVTARDAAIEANAAKSLFVASMSHELRTPLHSIIGYAELIQEGAGQADGELGTDLQAILTAARHLLSLVNNVLDISKMGSAQIVVDREEMSPTALINDVMEALRPTAKKNGTLLIWGASPPSFSAYCDDVKFRQCIFNLISNAIKFTKSGVVEVALTQDDDGREPAFAVEVRDNGIGIAADQIGKLFEPFVQANPQIARAYGGTGLGLAITRSLARAMGGDLSVRSSLGEGSCFTLRLPCGCAGIETLPASPAEAQRNDRGASLVR